MPQNILIAALGDHPGVVTAMVKALCKIASIQVDILHVVHPHDTGKYIGREGFRLIAGHLAGTCQVISEPLDFADPNTTETSEVFLKTLAGLLERYRDQEQYHVYLSLAGGRKNTSALMALITQFFPSVRGLYHLIDKLEQSHHPSFPSIEEMELVMSKEDVQAALDPPAANLKLVSIPYPGAFADADKLWQILQTGGSLGYSPKVEAFFGPVTSCREAEPKLKIWVSERATQDYRRLGPQWRNKFVGYVRRMLYPIHLKAKASGPRGWETDCQVYPEHKADSNLRLFYYWDRPAQIVTICRAMLHQEYDRKGELWHKDHPAAHPIADLENEYTLLVPLGKAPMIATQTYTLLQESEDEGQPRIPVVAILYPERHRVIEKGVRLLKRQFKSKGIEFVQFPIKKLKDVDSDEACETYLQALLTAIEKLRQKYPDRRIALSLSGGRKGMSALSLFAAQRTGIEQIYHTLITDIELEKRIEDETSIQALERLPTDADRAKRLFLEEYDRRHFELFTIPVIPWE